MEPESELSSEGDSATRLNCIKVLTEELRSRYVDMTPSTDITAIKLSSCLTAQARALLAQIKTLTEQAIEKIEESEISSLDAMGDLQVQIDKLKYQNHYPVIPSQYFDKNREQYFLENLPISRNTMMLNFIDYYCLPLRFTYSSDRQWSLPPEAYLVSRKDSIIKLPRPGLAVGFTLQSLTGEDDSAPIPEELQECISPDGGERCFPFLFFEVGEDFKIANLYNASQALYNIYKWMAFAGHEEQFLKTVRIYSVTLGVQEFSIRVHRAEKDPRAIAGLRFKFDEFLCLSGYTKLRASQFIKAILAEPATELLDVLRAAFDVITGQEDERVAAKRRRVGV